VTSRKRSFGEVWRKRRTDGTWAWYVRYRENGKRVSQVAGRTRSEAEAFLSARQTEAAHARLDGVRVRPRVTMAEFLPRVEAAWKVRLEKTTLASRKSVVRRIAERFGHARVADIPREEIEAWLLSLPVAPSSRRQVHLVLSSVFTAAIGAGVLRENPCRGVKLGKKRDCAIPFLEPETLRRLYAAMRPDIRAAVVLMGEAGLRRNEALMLRWRDLDGDGVSLVGKGGKYRRLHLTQFAREALATHRALCPGLPDARLFRIHPPQFNQEFRAVADALGLPDVTPHVLRHAFGSGLVRAGVDLPTVARLMGHSRIETTMRYAQWAPAGADARAIEQLAEARHGATRESHSATAEGSTR
jgi:integrase